MERIFYVLVLLGALTTCAEAQTVDYDKIVVPADVKAKTFEDYLVQQSYNNYASTRVLTGNVAIADLAVRRAKWAWLDHINANVNFSSQQDSIFGRFGGGTAPNPATGEAGDPRYLRPGYNYGLAVNLGGLINNKKEVDIARQKRLIASAKLDERKHELRAMVLDRLEQYDNAREILRIRRQAQIDAETNNALVQSLFEQGKAQFEDVAQASEVYHRAVESTALAKSDVRRARYGVEELAGQPWSELEPVRTRMSVEGRGR